MATGLAVGGFAQGLSQGLNSGFSMAQQADKNRREQERFDLEKPKLEAEAAAAEQEKLFREKLAEGMRSLAAEAKGGETVAPDGTVTQRPPMDPLDMEMRSAEIFKQAMFDSGKLDFAQLKQAREFTQEMESKGVLEAMRYAKANPEDQEGIRKMLKKAKVDLDPSITVGLQDGPFGPTVAGFRAGKNGKQEVVFTSAELLAPYIGAQAFAQMEEKRKLTKFEQEEATKRTGMQVGATMYAADARERGETRRAALAASKEGTLTAKDQFTALNSAYDNLASNFFRNPLPGMKPWETADILAKARAASSQYFMTGRVDANTAYMMGLQEAFKRAGKTVPPELVK